MTIMQYTRQCAAALEGLYTPGECQWLVRVAIEHFTGWDRTRWALHCGDELSPGLREALDGVTARLLAREPIQYILGTTRWHGLDIDVTPAVLIPRAETSELVDIIADRNPGSDLRVLDVCTGSGCIAIALARTLPFAAVTATDISDGALDVARGNATRLKARVDFRKLNALYPSGLGEGTFDIVVSNPPYIGRSEAREMDSNVLDWEPHAALFVDDADPLVFYRSIAADARRLLRPGGRLYFEINPLHAASLRSMLVAGGWESVETLRDMHSRERFAAAVTPMS